MFSRRRTYLDIAAGVSGNSSSPHSEGRAAHEALERARSAIARLLESKADDVLFTSGATAANALAILGTVRTYQRTYGRAHVLYHPGAHASIVENMKLAETEGAVIEPLPIVNCKVDTDALAEVLRPETSLVAMEAVCGETGVVWNTREVALALHGPSRAQRGIETVLRSAQDKRVLLHVDASQAPWTQKLTRAHFGADLLTLDSSKVCEVRGIGCLIAPRTIPLVPLYGGGGQERALVPGSEAPALATAFAQGLARAAGGRAMFHACALQMRTQLVKTIKKSIRGVLVNESSVEQDPHILNLSLPGRDTDYLTSLLDEAGFALSTVSACESTSGEPSRAVLALWGDRERAASTLRISWGPRARERDLSRFSAALIRAVAFIDSSKAP